VILAIIHSSGEQGFNPFTANPVKVLHVAMLV